MDTGHGNLLAAAAPSLRGAQPSPTRGGGLFSIREVLDELLGGPAATAFGGPAPERLVAAATPPSENRLRDRRRRRAALCG